MSGFMVLGYATKAVGRPLEPFEYPAPELGPHDIRVSVTHCGVCHTDVHAIENYYGITAFPFVPGHEIVGHVTELGPAVSVMRVGDRVGIGWQGRSCGQCEWCLKGEEQLCMDIVPSGTWVPYGGFSSSVVADSRFAYTLPPGMPSEVAAVLMCAGITVYSPLRKNPGGPGTKIAVVGVGGLGHLAIQFAHAFGYDVAAISSSPQKKDEALAFGADRFIDVNDEAGLGQVDYGFDMLICTASGGVRWEALLMTLKKKGVLVLLGFPDVALNSTDLVAHELSITGSFLGNRARMREMLAFAATHRIAPKVEVMPMSRVNEAIQRIRDNKARYRIVLVNDAAGTAAARSAP
jgi:D-arabinose 1-dehydrogenase-like Zn-dependent alcohol dehydrogenase